MQAYNDLLNTIIAKGKWVTNPRTGERCLTIPRWRFEFGPNDPPPVDTTRFINTQNPVAELLGYMRGIDSAAEMRKIGTNTWNANANTTKAWLANPHRKGEDDLGYVYGKMARNWPKYDGTTIDLIQKVYDNLRNGIDDRGEIITYWNPGYFELGCLRPCMYSYQFTLLGDELHVDVDQRSCDVPLGTGNVNMIQTYILPRLWAHITGKQVGTAELKMVNCHIYENQIELAMEHASRKPLDNPDLALWINPEIKVLKDIETWVTVNDIKIVGYENHHPVIKYPFTA